VQGPEELKNIFDGFGYFSIIIFLFLYVIANVLLTPSYPFVFASGIIFGMFWGTVISLIGEVCSATVNFFLGRKVEKAFFVHKIHDKKIQFVKKYIEKHDFVFILITRYLGFYFDIVSYAAGMTRIKYKHFLIATFIGFLPYILIYVYAGNQLMDIRSSGFVYSIVIFKLILVGTFVLGYIIYELMKKVRNAKKLSQ
jgi:uncharacterized membrane protein YdjX (TVP38/TMEM64 family)